jgi:methane monooxygenase component A beta chain/propane monooxygenase small subunit
MSSTPYVRPPRSGAGGDFVAARELTYIRPTGRRLTDYEAVVCHTQPDLSHFEVSEWSSMSARGERVFDPDTTRARHPDWFEFRDPSQLWQRTYVREQAVQESALQTLLQHACPDAAGIDASWLDPMLSSYFDAMACMEWGLFLALSAAVRPALSDTVSVALCFAAVDHLRMQQDIALLGLHLETYAPSYVSGGVEAWLHDPVLQPARALIEEVMAVDDWCELAIVTSLVVEPLLAGYLGAMFRAYAPFNGDALAPLVLISGERDRKRRRAMATALAAMLLTSTDRSGRPVPADHNRRLLQGWIDRFAPSAVAAARAVRPVFESQARQPAWSRDLLADVIADTEATLGKVGLVLPSTQPEVLG